MIRQIALGTLVLLAALSAPAMAESAGIDVGPFEVAGAAEAGCTGVYYEDNYRKVCVGVHT